MLPWKRSRILTRNSLLWSKPNTSLRWAPSSWRMTITSRSSSRRSRTSLLNSKLRRIAWFQHFKTRTSKLRSPSSMRRTRWWLRWLMSTRWSNKTCKLRRKKLSPGCWEKRMRPLASYRQKRKSTSAHSSSNSKIWSVRRSVSSLTYSQRRRPP